MSDIIQIGLHRSTLKALAALEAHTFSYGQPVFSIPLQKAAFVALMVEFAKTEDEVTLRLALECDNAASLTQEVLTSAGLLDEELEKELLRCGMTWKKIFG